MATTYLYGDNVHANGIRHHYLRYGGSGTPLVLLPGITSPAITWGFVADILGDTHDVYVLDARGRGLSETRDDLAYDMETYADDVLAFVEALGADSVAITGPFNGRTHRVNHRRAPA